MQRHFFGVVRAVSRLLFVVGCLLLSGKNALAATITSISYGPTGSTVGTFVQANDTDFTLFTPITAITAGSTITLTFPSGTTLTTADISASDFTIAQATQGLCTNAGADTAASDISANATNRTITLTVAAASLSKTVALVNCGLGVVTIKTSGTLGGTEIRHPTTATTTGTYQIDTSVGDTGSITNVSFVHDTVTQLAFSTQPSSAANAGVDFGTQPQISVQDQYGNTVTSDSSTSVTIAAVLASDGTTAGGGTLNATTNPVTASSGVATFAGVDYTKAEDIKLRATATGLTSALSSTIAVSPGSATQLAFTTQPSSTAFGGTNFSTQPVVTIRDAFNNTVTGSSASITLTAVLASDGTTAGSGTLNATSNPLSASSGVATFAGLNYTVGENIKLKAASAGLSDGLSDAISVTSAAVSGVSASTTNSTATISWSSNTEMSTQIEYGLTSSYGNSTTEIDTSPRVTSHSQTVSNLASCTTFHYRAKSNAAGGNQAVSADSTFTTGGCVGSASVLSETSATITNAAGGTVSLLGGGAGVTLTAPAGFGGYDAEFQIKHIAPTPVLNIAPAPSNYLITGNLTYDLRCLTSTSDAQTSFTNAITVTFSYADTQIMGLNESSLRIFRWDGSSWQLLSGCSVNRAANTVSCSTTAFSTFALFGQQTPLPGPPAPSKPSCDLLPPGAKAPWIYAAIPLSNTEIQLYFTEPDTPYDRIALAFGRGKIEYGSDNIGGSGLRTYTVRDLQPNTGYLFRTRAGNGCAPGGWSNDISAKTLGNFHWRPITVSQPEITYSECQDVHEVVEGDTLWGISRQYFGSGTKVGEIRQRNKETFPSLLENDRLRIGWELQLPCIAAAQSSKTSDGAPQPVRKYDVTVTVVDQDGQPVPNAVISIASGERHTQMTNNLGDANFVGLPEGQHFVTLKIGRNSTDSPLHLTGDVSEVRLKLTAQKQAVFLSPAVIVWVASAIAGSATSVAGLMWAQSHWFSRQKMLP